MYQEYKKQQRINQINQKILTMYEDMRSMSGTDFKSKYGNPSKVWADLKWQLYLAKKNETIDSLSKKQLRKQ